MTRAPTLANALVPVGLLIGMLATSVYLFGDESSSGPNQIVLMLATGVVLVIGLIHGHTWTELEAGISRGITVSIGAILILLVVGSLIGAWILAGVVPTMIYYGLSILSPSVFYAAACVISAVVALATGSSWTTAGTIGIALIGVATAQGLHLGLAAGAIISGAYFGDKMSPLSDTTNLAPAVAGTDLFSHIRHMVWTTTPSFAVAVLLFVLAGVQTSTSEDATELTAVLDVLGDQFAIGPHLLVPVLVVIALVVRRVPAFPALLIGALVGSVFAAVFQREAITTFVDDPTLSTPVAVLKGVWIALYGGFELRSGHAVVDDLLSRGGMASMLTTVWLIISAMMFGAVMETTGLLHVIAESHPLCRSQHRQFDLGDAAHVVRHERVGRGPVHRDRPARPDVSTGVRAAASRPEESLTDARRLGHPDVCPGSLEYVRRLHGSDTRRLDPDLRTLRVL